MSETFPKIVRSDNRHTPIAALHVEVIADLVCPFCYLGKRRLELALKQLSEMEPERWITHRFPIEGAQEAYALIDQHPEQTIQVLFKY